MKSADFNATIDILDGEASTLVEKLDGLDPASDEYGKVAHNLKTIQEAKQIEVRNLSEHRSGKVPGWVQGVLGTVIATAFGAVVMRVESRGGVVSSQAINLWDKVIRKF